MLGVGLALIIGSRFLPGSDFAAIVSPRLAAGVGLVTSAVASVLLLGCAVGWFRH